eukprot:CAMPEP_0180385168 /NCGR_PEP_ID=MMETSP0989-20121125/28961_1 /TAXON_ID=697907 /ORGANISM="non described non described, Strain CCMP2293" /LENGTH=32 /DNA_ID= /DNA_START= /DNA_END= /DNA_ORIENTATION=
MLTAFPNEVHAASYECTSLTGHPDGARRASAA